MINSRSPLKMSLLAAAVATIAVAFGGSPASASAAAVCSDGEPGYLCLWEHSSPYPLSSYRSEIGEGRSVALKTGASNLHNSLRFGDKTSQINNNTDQYWCVYEHTGYRGKMRMIGPNARSLFFAGEFWNDKISSVRVCIF
jgi:hypothetical protein